MIELTDEMMADRNLTKDMTRIAKLNPTDKINFSSNIIKYINGKNYIIYNKTIDGEKKEVKLKSVFETKKICWLNIVKANNVDKFIGKIIVFAWLRREKRKK